MARFIRSIVTTNSFRKNYPGLYRADLVDMNGYLKIRVPNGYTPYNLSDENRFAGYYLQTRMIR